MARLNKRATEPVFSIAQNHSVPLTDISGRIHPDPVEQFYQLKLQEQQQAHQQLLHQQQPLPQLSSDNQGTSQPSNQSPQMMAFLQQQLYGQQQYYTTDSNGQQTLTQQQLIKLHKYFDHASADSLWGVIKNSSNKEEYKLAELQEIYENCDVCNHSKRKMFKKKTSLPRSTGFRCALALLDQKLWLHYKVTPLKLLKDVDVDLNLYFHVSKICLYVNQRHQSPVAKPLMRSFMASLMPTYSLN